MMLDPVFIPVCVVLVLSGLIHGMFGFGFGVIAVGLLPFFMSVKATVPMVAMQGMFYNAIILYGLRRHINLRLAYPLLVGLLGGLPFGVYLLRIMSEEAIRKLLGVVILAHVLYSVQNPSPGKPVLQNKAWGLAAGVLSGIVAGAILAAGPIAMAYLTLRGLSKETLKATFLTWSTVMTGLLIPFYAFSGFLTTQILHWGLLTIPFVGLGIYVGIKIFDRLEQRIFYRLIIVFLAAIGVNLLVF